MHTLLLSCKKAAALIDRRSMTRLSVVEQAQLWMHLNICHGCRSFEHQSEAIDRILEQEREVDVSARTVPLEDRIIEALK